MTAAHPRYRFCRVCSRKLYGKHFAEVVIADALGYAGHSSAARAARRWERMRGRQAR